MKPRLDKDVRKPRKNKKPKPAGENLDELGVTRGQNGEKGNTIKPENIRDEGQVSH